MFKINFKNHRTKYNYSTKLKQNCIVNAPICTSIFGSRLWMTFFWVNIILEFRILLVKDNRKTR